MHADFEAGIAHRSHGIGGAPADVGAGQQGAVKERAYAVVLEHRGAIDLGEETRPENAPQRPAGVVGAEAEKKSAAGAMFFQQSREPWHAFLGTAQRVDVDL